MNKLQMLKVAGTIGTVAFALTGCGSDTGTPTAPEESQTQEQQTPESSVDHEQLLNLNDQLSSSLGAAYVQGWIQDDKLHVATNDESKVQEIEEAGAVAEFVKFSSQQLRDAIGKIMAWQAEQEPEIANAIHGYSISAKDGGLILRVGSKHLDQVKELMEKDQPAGEIKLTFTPSSGIASPAVGQP